MYCKSCGRQIDDDAAFCSHCGTKLKGQNKAAPIVQPQASPQQPVVHVINNNVNNVYGRSRKSKWVAFFLCFFLGFFGVHRFYVGKIGTGLLWFFSAGLFGIGWAIDLFAILFGSFRDRDGQRLA